VCRFRSSLIGARLTLLSARGIAVGDIEQHRQGALYFDIHDPAGNTIEVVEEP